MPARQSSLTRRLLLHPRALNPDFRTPMNALGVTNSSRECKPEVSVRAKNNNHLRLCLSKALRVKSASRSMGRWCSRKVYSPTLALKELVTRLGRHLSTRHIQVVNSVLNYLEVGRWTEAHGFEGFPRHYTRLDLHSTIAAPIAEERVLYLEFGVYQGQSLRHWCDLLRNSTSSLHGFDSFHGLPEKRDALRGKGTFTLGGRLPRFDDQRVVLHPRLVQGHSPRFRPPST
jgi:hypothetical protein